MPYFQNADKSRYNKADNQTFEYSDTKYTDIRNAITKQTDQDTSLTNKGRNVKIIVKTGKNISEPSYTEWGYRHQQCFIMFCTFAIAFSMRSSMGVALVAMTKFNETSVNMTDLPENSTETMEPRGVLDGLMLVPPYPIFDWNKREQNMAIASFYWGYTTMLVPAGQLAHRFGAKHLLIAAMAINSATSIVLPTVTYYGGWYCTIICRVTQGLSQAFIIPGIQTLLGKWVPLHERGKLASFVFGAESMGTVLGLPLTGFISASSMGWPGIFRVYGVLAGIMAVLIYLFLSNTPAKHNKISYRERKYIENDVGTIEGKKKRKVPWSKILSHEGVYATVAGHVASTWGHLLLYAEIPAYMDKIMGVNIKANGLLSALPFIIMWCSGFFFNWLTDWMVVKNVMSVTNSRKVAIALGTVPPGLGLIALGYAPNNIYVVEAILTVICVFKISMFCGFPVNQIDISPNFAGTIVSISNFTANIGSSFAPLVTSFILTDVTDRYLWRRVFFVASGVYLATNIIYWILGTSEQAEWNDAPEERHGEEEDVPIMNGNK